VQLLVVRHGTADPRETFPGPDAERALTEDGRERMERAARGLRRLVPRLDCIASSPLRRAVQTARILSEAYDGQEVVETACLTPGADVRELAAWLASRKGDAVAIVGHEPDLSIAICWLSSGVAESGVALGKGGAALVELPAGIAAGRGRLQWLLRPSQLRRLAG
jgi:phosphohistidine phosphatase